MAHPQEKRMALRSAYLGGLPIEQAAAQAGVPLGTARRWKTDALAEGDDWDKFQRASIIMAGGGIDQAMGRVASGVLMRCEALMDRLSNPDLDPLEATKAIGSITDSLAKLHAASKRLMPATDRLAVAQALIQQLSSFIRERYPQHIGAFAEVLEPFGREVLQAGGE